jgi:hypothetical protein
VKEAYLVSRIAVELKLLDERHEGAGLVEMRTDSKSGLAAYLRRGVGRVKHTTLKLTWLQQQVRNDVVQSVFTESRRNCADVLTKPLGLQAFNEHVRTLGVVPLEAARQVAVLALMPCGGYRRRGEVRDGRALAVLACAVCGLLVMSRAAAAREAQSEDELDCKMIMHIMIWCAGIVAITVVLGRRLAQLGRRWLEHLGVVQHRWDEAAASTMYPSGSAMRQRRRPQSSSSHEGA